MELQSGALYGGEGGDTGFVAQAARADDAGDGQHGEEDAAGHEQVLFDLFEAPGEDGAGDDGPEDGAHGHKDIEAQIVHAAGTEEDAHRGARYDDGYDLQGHGQIAEGVGGAGGLALPPFIQQKGGGQEGQPQEDPKAEEPAGMSHVVDPIGGRAVPPEADA